MPQFRRLNRTAGSPGAELADSLAQLHRAVGGIRLHRARMDPQVSGMSGEQRDGLYGTAPGDGDAIFAALDAADALITDPRFVALLQLG